MLTFKNVEELVSSFWEVINYRCICIVITRWDAYPHLVITINYSQPRHSDPSLIMIKLHISLSFPL